MSELTAEDFAQRVQDSGLLDFSQMETVWSEIGTRDVSLEEYISFLLRKELLTNLQIDRLRKGERKGYFYGKYKVLYLVGTGTFARVYRAVHVETGQVVAVKVLRNRYSDEPIQRERFLCEAKLVMALRHINIVPIYEADEARRRPYMVMEFVEGQNLREFLKVRKRFDVLDSLRLISDVAAGLDYALGQNVTHRDLKLSNILVTSTGRAKLVDFGLAAISAVAKTDASGKTSSPRSIDYAALERITSVRKDDPRSDIYFAGCILYHLLSGEPPLLETKERTQRLNASRFHDVIPIMQHIPDLPGSVAALVNRAMELDAERRFGTPAEFLAELKTVLHRLEHGEAEDYGEEGGQGRRRTLDREGDSRRVMVVESNADMQDALRDLLKRRGYRVLVISDVQRALGRFEDNEPPCDCVIFCTTELGESALEGFNKFGDMENVNKIPAILFISENDQDLARQAKTAEHRVLLKMPLKVRQLRTMLLKLLSRSAAEDQ